MSSQQRQETNLYGQFHSPIHTGSGDIIIGDVVKIILPDRTIELGPDERAALLADYREYLRHRYAHLPLAGIPVPLSMEDTCRPWLAVLAVVFHPTLAKTIEAAGEPNVAEFQRRFGGLSEKGIDQ